MTTTHQGRGTGDYPAKTADIEDAAITLAKMASGVLGTAAPKNVTLSTAQPTGGDGVDGDFWIVVNP